jgi:hypothetical protein
MYWINFSIYSISVTPIAIIHKTIRAIPQPLYFPVCLCLQHSANNKRGLSQAIHAMVARHRSRLLLVIVPVKPHTNKLIMDNNTTTDKGGNIVIW